MVDLRNRDAKLQALLAGLPLHGGDVHSAAKRCGLPVHQLIDLSTGINPEPYPIPELPSQAFNHLPYLQDDFIHAAKNFYGQEHFLAVAGTQSVIQLLPRILDPNFGDAINRGVLLPSVGYQEHARQWGFNKTTRHYYRSTYSTDMVKDINASLARNADQHVVIINPNNPTATLFNVEQILMWSKLLAEGAYLIIDEAFVDITQENSVLSRGAVPSNVIVLRSFGKFFGLAGIRLGFVFASPSVLNEIEQSLGVWQVNGPAQYIATRALSDSLWQNQTKERVRDHLEATAELFKPLIERFELRQPYKSSLFLSYPMPLLSALLINHGLITDGVLTRVVVLDDEHALLRTGCINRYDTQAVNTVEAAIDKLCKLRSIDCLLESPIKSMGGLL